MWTRDTPFGDWRTEPTAGLTDRGYTGHRQNNMGSGPGDIGLIYMNARYYVPTLNRHLSADTIVPDFSDAQSLNRYTYVLNSPLNFTDPFGHCASGYADAVYDDYECWQLAEELNQVYGISLELLGVLDLNQLQFMGQSLLELSNIDEMLPSAIKDQINAAISGYNLLDYIAENSGWDVLGVRAIDGSISFGLGLNGSFDVIFNFRSLELSVFANGSLTFGLQAGAAVSSGVFLGFNVPDNSPYRGWGTGITFGGAVPGVGGTVQLEASGKIVGLAAGEVKGEPIYFQMDEDSWNLTVMYSTGLEAELSWGVGYSYEIATFNFNDFTGCVFNCR